MLLLKEKELNKTADEDINLRAPKKRIMPSRASYYANLAENNSVPVKDEEYTIELIRGGRAVPVTISDNLDINSTVSETDLKQYEKLSPNLLPSGATMRSLSTHRAAENIESAEEAIDFKVNKKGLLMLIIYAAIIIGIFAFIITNAVSLVNLMNTTGSLEQRLAQENANLESLQKQIDLASDPDNLYDRLEGEWVPAEPGGTINLEATAPEAEGSLKGSTNIFDWILDNLFGGGFNP